MLDLLLSVPGMRDHWLFWLAAYLAIGLRIGLKEALKTRADLRRQDVADSLWPTVAVLTLFWIFLPAAKFVFWLILCWDVLQIRRADAREAALYRGSAPAPASPRIGPSGPAATPAPSLVGRKPTLVIVDEHYPAARRPFLARLFRRRPNV